MTRRTKSNHHDIPVSRRILYAAVPVFGTLALLGLLELALRWADYGPDLDLFHREAIDGVEYYGINRDVSQRYFTTMDVSPATSADLFRVNKPPGTFRLFFVGASAALGYPYMFNGSASAVIRDELSERYPNRSFEIVNLSMTAVTSHAVREFATIAMDYEPDAIVIYCGHNEYYGALGAGSHESFGPGWFTRLYLELEHVRSFLLLRDAIVGLSGLFGTNERPSGTLMEAMAEEKRIPLGSPLYDEGLRTFDANIREIVKYAQERNVPIVLSTVVTNLKDLKPFSSIFRTSVSASDREFITGICSDLDPEQASLWTAEQRSKLREAFTLDSTYALTSFLLGKDALSKGDSSEAWRYFESAKEYDGLRFRAPSAMNQIVRHIGSENGIPVADIEKDIRATPEGRIPGRELMFEHVHMNDKGYGRIAELLYPFVVRLFAQPEGEENIPPNTFHAHLTDIDRITAAQRMEILKGSWPFTNDRKTVNDLQANGTLEEYALSFLKGDWTWEQMHVAAAEWYERNGKMPEAEREYAALAVATPYNVSPFLRLGDIQLRLGKDPQARKTLLASMDIRRTSQAALRLGQIAFNAQRYSETLTYLREALSLGQLNAGAVRDVRLSICVALVRTGRFDEALERAQVLAKDSPDFAPAQELLAYLRSRAGTP